MKKSGFTLAEVLIAKREREKMSLLNLFRASELKAPSSEHRKQFAFTLAEVLITLAIIGVVAAMTIPILMNNYQKNQYVIQLKKAYSQTNQALGQMSAEYNCVNDLACTGIFDYDGAVNGDKTLGAALVKQFKITKDCQTASTGGCWASSVMSNYDGTGSSYNINTWYYSFVTAEGMSFSVNNGVTSCGSNNSVSGTGPMSKRCGELWVDVNGTKLPNIVGRDVFKFWIVGSALLYPAGGADDAAISPWRATNGTINYCYKTYPGGLYCTGRVIEEGWKMNY